MARRNRTRPVVASVPAPTTRGFRGPGRALDLYVQAPVEFRGTTVQTCGMWPWVIGAGAPINAVPLGRDLRTGQTVCADPISYFNGGRGIIANPSVFMLGLPGFGKSTCIARMIMGLSAFGVVPLILGDLKPDYLDVVEALDGQVIRVGPGRGALNVLDASEAHRAASRLQGSLREELLGDWHERRREMIAALVTITRKAPPSDQEEHLISAAISLLDERHPGIPTLHDLIALIDEAPDELRVVAMDRGSLDRYRDVTENLLRSLRALVGDRKTASVFANQTSEPMRRDRPVIIDISSIEDSQQALQAQVLTACWGIGMGLVHLSQVLADEGLEPRRHYLPVLDELWRALRAGKRHGRPHQHPHATEPHAGRRRRALHPHDVRPHRPAGRRGPHDRAGARGAGGDAGLRGAAAAGDAATQPGDRPLSAAEQDLLQSWGAPPAWSSRLLENSDAPTGADDDGPPGRGKFLLRSAAAPGSRSSRFSPRPRSSCTTPTSAGRSAPRIAREQQEAAEATGAGV